MTIVNAVRRFFEELQGAAGPLDADPFSRPLIVGVSGGPDSVALLHVLAKAGFYPHDGIVVAHLNHMIRSSAAAEAAFVASLAEKWQLTFRTRAVKVDKLSEEAGLSMEAAARQARYAFLADVAREFGAGWVVTGHTQNDQAETVLMHFIRGSGLSGLRGMQPVSTVPGAPDLKLMRPLLSVDRETIQEYNTRHGLEYVEDESNSDVSLFRNRLRHELLPILARENPQLIARLESLSRVVDGDEAMLAQILDEHWSELVVESSESHLVLELPRWRSLPLSLRRRSLRHAALMLRPELSDVSFEVTELAREVAEKGNSGDQVALPGDVRLSLEYERLVFAAPDHNETLAVWPQLATEGATPLAVPGELGLSEGWVLSAERVEVPDFQEVDGNSDSWQAYISVSFAGDLMVRPRLPGERLCPLGMHGSSSKISHIMTNRKIPARARRLWPIVASKEHALWLTGHILDERAHVHPREKQALLLRARRLRPVDLP